MCTCQVVLSALIIFCTAKKKELPTVAFSYRFLSESSFCTAAYIDPEVPIPTSFQSEGPIILGHGATLRHSAS